MDKSQTEKKDHFSYYREDGLMNEEFWGKGENSDIPLIFEGVSVDENGKETGKGGDTHFHFFDKEIGVSYGIYDSPEIAMEQFNKSVEKAEKVIRKGIIKNEKSENVGVKALIIQKSKVTKANFYCLIWTRNSRFTILSSDSLKAIEEYEKDRKL